jgi:hypothetical protein
MAWINILDIPGLTYLVQYKGWGYGMSWEDVPLTDPVSVISKAFVANHRIGSFPDWSYYRVMITSPIEYPLAVRIRVTARETSVYGDTFTIGDQYPYQGVRLEVMGGSPPVLNSETTYNYAAGDYAILNYEAGYDFGTTDTSVIIEINTVEPFWKQPKGAIELP